MRLSGWSLPLERLSATSLGTFVQCPEQFRRKYILNEPEKMWSDRFMGAVQHRAIQHLFERSKLVSQESLAAQMTTAIEVSIEQSWNEVIEKEGEPDWLDSDPTESYRRTKQMLTTYAPIAWEIKPVAVEQRFEEKIAGVNISGYIDRELSDRILEVKTASQKVSKPKPRWNLQGRLYSLVSAKPIEWHVITRQVTPKVYTAAEEGCEDLYVPHFEKDLTVKLIQFAVARMNDLYARHGKEEPWPMDGVYGDWTCRYCSFQKNCPAWSNAPTVAG